MSEQLRLNPWKTLKSEKVYDSPWIGLTKHDVLNPSGNPGTYSVVHFKNLAIGVLPLDNDYNTGSLDSIVTRLINIHGRFQRVVVNVMSHPLIQPNGNY